MKKISKSTKIGLTLSLIVGAIVLLANIPFDKDSIISNSATVRQNEGMSVKDFQTKISNKEKLVLVYFNASWCVPCIKLKPIIAELQDEVKAYCEVLPLNVDDNKLIAEYYEINSLPLFIIYKDGKKLWENIGVLSKSQLQSKISSLSK